MATSVLSETQRESRERLVGLLWSELTELRARAVLRQVVRELRVLIEQEDYQGLHISTSEIWFDPQSIEVDVLSVVAAAEAGKVHPLLLKQQHLIEDLLAGLEDLDPAFRAWLLAKRHTLSERLLRALEVALVAIPLGKEPEITVAAAITNLDPTHEEACRRLMRARAVRGDVAGALRIYNDLWDLLGRDYDMEPSADTQELVAAIKTGTVRTLPGTVTIAVPQPASRTATQLAISVPAFATQALDPDKVHLVTGFRQVP